VKKGIAFFDFDGTITSRDTLLAFISFSKGRMNFLSGFLLHAPWLIAYKLNIISNQKAKEKVLAYFFGGMKLEKFTKLCAEFSEIILPQLIRPAAIEEILSLQSKGFQVVVVSASPKNWIQSWAEKTGVELMATELEVKNDSITGKIRGNNCHGEEKVRRIREKYVLANYEEIFAYGDTSGDRPMLNLATTSFFRPFREGNAV
jgi:HAD superfamily hydrolase (TIGR01490 family)